MSPVHRCSICNASSAVAMVEAPRLPGGWRCRDEVSCRRRVRGAIESAKLAQTLDEPS